MALTKVLLVGVGLAGALTARAVTLPRTATIPLPNVAGRIDHLALDATGKRLFVAALGNNTVEVVDLRHSRIVHTIAGLAEPQGLFFVAEHDRLYVANGGDGTLRTFDGTTFAAGPVIRFEGDADNVRYDDKSKLLYVGYGGGAIGVIDTSSEQVLATIALPGHPESVQLERNGERLFVNVPQSRALAVINRKTRTVTGNWSLGSASSNFPMALDERSHRVFVGCRSPARLLVIDAGSGWEVAALDLHADCDDVFFDATRHRIYASCGAGYLDVFQQETPDQYRLQAAVETAPKARTCFFDGSRVYVAVPRSSDRQAEIQVFDTTQ
jgi:DNA-binding beta-propeller fold protein YncE